MKNKLIIGALSATVIFGGAVAAGAASNEEPELNNNLTVEGGVLETALSKVEGQVQSLELDHKSEGNYFEIEIESSVNEYEMEI